MLLDRLQSSVRNLYQLVSGMDRQSSECKPGLIRSFYDNRLFAKLLTQIRCQQLLARFWPSERDRRVMDGLRRRPSSWELFRRRWLHRTSSGREPTMFRLSWRLLWRRIDAHRIPGTIRPSRRRSAERRVRRPQLLFRAELLWFA